MIVLGLAVILLAVLAAPFFSKRIEENLEPFLLMMGIAALSVGLKCDGEDIDYCNLSK